MCEFCICHDCIDRGDCYRCTKCNSGDLKIKSCSRRARHQHKCENCGYFTYEKYCPICGAEL